MYNHILVALDLSDITTAVCQVAEDLARLCHADLCLLHVEAPEPDFIGYAPGPQSVRDSVAHEIQDDQHLLNSIARGFRESGIETKAMLLQGATAEKILEEAGRFDADLIIMGTHRHGTFYHLFIGNTNDDVLVESPCPVMLVPNKTD